MTDEIRKMEKKLTRKINTGRVEFSVADVFGKAAKNLGVVSGFCLVVGGIAAFMVDRNQKGIDKLKAKISRLKYNNRK